MNKFYIYLFIALSFSSCKEDKSKTDKTVIDSVDAETNENEETDFFALTMDAAVKKDGDLTLFYLEEGQNKITRKNSVNIPVIGNENFQTLTFRIDKDILPTRLIFKFGNAEKSQTIIFNEILITYNDNEILITKEDFFWNFNPNKFVNYDRASFTAITVEKDGVFDPFFVSREILVDKMHLEL
ncbi:hypothetical protein [Winogradskyella marincola]|uniref:Uncharacterized protein n=1 Tax=Winogradskyella marincola TaxID=3037795 RepID=A0ABT6G026_9FLAO|nr:hypothetical protein [Winogradskyella sp. YYF002]MDG4715199.1 hypothetical protein [Winogradskyella sp. YYF002]